MLIGPSRFKIIWPISGQRFGRSGGWIRKIAAGTVEGIECRGDVVEFVGVEIGGDVRGHRDRRVAHRLLQEAQIRAGAPRQ